MKRFSRIFVAALLIVATALTLSSCGARSVDEITESGNIILATNAEFEPFEYIDNGEIVGIDVEIGKKIAEKLGVELEISNMEFDSVVASVKAGKSDFGAAGLSITEERLENVDFSDSYFDASQMIVVPMDSDITGEADLTGKKVGVQLGTTGADYCTNTLEGVEVVNYDKYADAIQALISDKVDAVVVDNFPATKYVEKNSTEIKMLDTPLTSEPYAIAVNKGNEELLDIINEVLDEMEASGELDELIDSYSSAILGE